MIISTEFALQNEEYNHLIKRILRKNLPNYWYMNLNGIIQWTLFIKIYNKRQDLSDIQDIKSYLFSTLRNKILDEIRRKAYFTEKEIESYQVASSENVEKEYLLKEKEDYDNVKVAFFMTKLSHRQREAITLYFIEEKKYDEICTLMDINYQSLRNLIHRSLTKLRSQLSWTRDLHEALRIAGTLFSLRFFKSFFPFRNGKINQSYRSNDIRISKPRNFIDETRQKENNRHVNTYFGTIGIGHYGLRIKFPAHFLFWSHQPIHNQNR